MSSKFKVQSWKLEEPPGREGAAGGRPDFELGTLNFELLVSDVRKSFRDPAGGALEVLRGATLALRAGESLAVVGASGAGKSTLLHVLCGLEAADSGGLSLGGFDISRATEEELARWRGREVGFVFQFHHLLADLTAEENVALPLVLARARWREARREAARMLDAVGLAGRAAHRPGELSGGEQQRVAVARALVRRPRLVLADEPTGNLDARNAADVGTLLLTLCRDVAACLVVATHNEQLARTCDRRLVLRDGRLHDEGPATPTTA